VLGRLPTAWLVECGGGGEGEEGEKGEDGEEKRGGGRRGKGISEGERRERERERERWMDVLGKRGSEGEGGRREG
jgi:hypothetical protein